MSACPFLQSFNDMRGSSALGRSANSRWLAKMTSQAKAVGGVEQVAAMVGLLNKALSNSNVPFSLQR